MPNNTKPEVDNVKTMSAKDGRILITELVTSHAETRQLIDFAPNAYFNSIKLNYQGGLDITNMQDLKTLVLSTQVANAICASGNRKAQIRDGIKPMIGTSAAKQLAADGPDALINKDTIIKPEELTNYIGGNIKKLVSVLSQVGVCKDLNDIGAAESSPKKAASEPVNNTPKKRVNPRRTKTPPQKQSTQDVIVS